jgi:hypothetical protein
LKFSWTAWSWILFCIIMHQHSIPSIFIFYEVSTYTTLFETLIANTLDVWILDSVAGNRDRPHIHLLPLLVYQIFFNIKTKGLTSVTCGDEKRGRFTKTNTEQRSKCLKAHSDQSPRTYLLGTGNTNAPRPSHWLTGSS